MINIQTLRQLETDLAQAPSTMDVIVFAAKSRNYQGLEIVIDREDGTRATWALGIEGKKLTIERIGVK